MNDSSTTITKTKYLFYLASNFPYTGYVKGVGYAESMQKPFSMMTYDPYCGTMQNGSYPHIGYIPLVDDSPEKVVRSYGKDLTNEIGKRLVTDRGDYYDINMGNRDHLYLRKGKDLQIDLTVQDLDQSDAKFKISVSFISDEGNPTRYEKECSVDQLMYVFPDSHVDQLFTSGYEDPNDYHGELDLSLFPDARSAVEKGVSALSIPVSLGDEMAGKALKSDVWKYQIEDIKNVKDFKNSKGVTREYYKYKNGTKKLKNSYAERYEKDMAERLKNLKEGKDSRTAKQFRKAARLGKFSKGLNVAGLVFSSAELGIHLYDHWDDDNLLLQGRTWRLAADVAFSAIAFVPGWGWIAAGCWFIGTTIYDNREAIANFFVNTYEKGRDAASYAYEMGTGALSRILSRDFLVRDMENMNMYNMITNTNTDKTRINVSFEFNENRSGIPRDRTRVSTIDERLIELKMQGFKKK